MEINLEEDLVFLQMPLSNSEEVLSLLAEELYKKAYVKKEYISEIKEREKQYPTGLPSTDPAIAIPHANYKSVIKSGLAIVTLKEPVVFHNMGNTEEELPIRIVIMLAIKEPHGQIEMLQKITTIIQNEELRKEILNAQTKEELISLVNQSIA